MSAPFLGFFSDPLFFVMLIGLAAVWLKYKSENN